MFILDPYEPVPVAELRLEAERLRSLANCCDRIADGGFPGDGDLTSAPIIDGYQRGLAFTSVLHGAVTGHPLLPGTNRIITTSPVIAMDPLRGWARTRSRLYRLGRPYDGAVFHG